MSRNFYLIKLEYGSVGVLEEEQSVVVDYGSVEKTVFPTHYSGNYFTRLGYPAESHSDQTAA
jgi:hypothetical protein